MSRTTFGQDCCEPPVSLWSPPLQGALRLAAKPFARQNQSAGLVQSRLSPEGAQRPWGGPAGAGMSLGRLERTRPAQPMSEINMTPLIDVMLVLLIIFMVAAPLMSAALKLELPPSGEAAQQSQEPVPLQLAIDAKGQLFWNGEALSPAAFKEKLRALGQSQPDAELQLAIDQTVPYGKVAALLDQLQAAKLTRLAFATAPTPAASQ